MPARGKHRRPKPPRFSRSLAVAGTGGAALAIPLIGATGAHAQTASAAGTTATAASVAPVSGKTVQAVPVARTASATTSATTRKTTTYTVRSGDYLSKIADEQNLTGGWQRLYEDNRDAVGSDPSLIHPGLRLSLGAKAARAESSSGSSSSSSSSSSSGSSSSGSRSSQKSQGSSDSSASSKGSSSKSSSSKATTESASSSSGFTLPVRGAIIGTGYRVAGSMWSSGYHTGVDFVVPSGTTLRAVGAGTVVAAGWGGAYGNQVVIRLADGYYAQYAHLSALNVSVGQTVGEGQQIGYSGATGNVTGAHLHFEMRTTPDYGSDIDPLAYLRSHGVSV
ncbi:LysM peptidoglycan-binding domain-containing M23 family metallopeptidase [Streptomyces acidiscabies]|uniref:LysM peptidoglycan-binding domain-containing M23 family metallopeptidase n=1 Tax=Streptomyces acidiscabies TaxID=42234 RepID=UPI00095F291F|nr:LysM peptidoglycan-binding domain-containing M23 family metallopeptidase [Streptomyces acidiscabies]GAV44407.1 glycyl-glycine endopeptidase ALE-1 precursor [Streptomyces acidiscabies]